MNRRTLLVGGGSLAGIGAGALWLGASRKRSSAEYEDAVAAMRAALSQRPDAHELIRYATLAANSHNTQPWRFAVAQDQITIHPDLTRRTPVVDPDDHHLFVSLGCAVENLAIAAAARGQRGEPVFDKAGEGSIGFAPRPGAAESSALFDAIPQRQSTRADFDGRPVSTADLNRLTDAAIMPGVEMIVITDRPRIDKLRDLVVAGTSAQMADPAFLRELKSWLRFNPQQAIRTGDGLYSVASGSPALPDWLGPRFFDLLVTAQGEKDKYANHVRSSSGIAVFIGARENPAHWVAVGRACQRFALQATALGLKHAFINQPVEVAALRPELAALVGRPGRRADIVMRFGHGPTLPYSPRRPVAEILVPEPTE